MLAIGLIGAGLGALLTGGYQSMAPTAQRYGRTFTGLGRRSKQLALTYDDGPNDAHTLPLLELLAKHEVKATFFLIGRNVQQFPQIAREIVAAGHVVGNHTFTHPLLIFKSPKEIRAELSDCQRALLDAVGEPSRLFRPPFGGRRPEVLRIARQLGFTPVMWSVTGYDWKAPSAEYVEAKVSRRVRGGDVILLHDGGHLRTGEDRRHTLVATDHLIGRLKGDGYEFVTVPQMMKQNGFEALPPSVRRAVSTTGR